ncbi:MAG: NAD(P)-dependent oxidoreductase [Ktedonobacteraceae bacterium]|nr:NAD(P)-dependent oxidoreductase [Ktedonobacteraceae bacterium]
MKKTVGIIGLGRMGLPIAANLLGHGFAVLGYRRHMSDDFVIMGGIPALSSKEVAEKCDVVITCLPGDGALLEAISGENGLVHGAHPGLTVVDISMLSIEAKEQAKHSLEQVGASMLDCPISGIPPQVLTRKTVLFASGEKHIFERCKPTLEGFTSTIFYLGDFGAGTKMKCVANLLVGIHVLAAAEAMTLSIKAGLDPATVIQVISPSVASSAQFVARAPMMAEQHYEPALSAIHQMEECIVIINTLSKAVNSPTPLLDTAARYYEGAIADGLGEKDVAVMQSFLEKTIKEN